MDAVLNVLLVRFAVMALVVVVLALVACAAVAVLRRRGRIDQARAGLDQIVRMGSSSRARRGDGGVGSLLAEAALRRLGGPCGRR